MLQAGDGSEALGESLNKAENAFVGALANKGCGLFAKEHAQALIAGFRNLYFVRGLLALKANGQVFVGHVKTVVYQVADQVTIDRANEVPRLNTRAVGGTSFHDFTHPSI